MNWSPPSKAVKPLAPSSLGLPAPPPSHPLPSSTSPPNLPKSSALALPPIKAQPLCRDAVHKSCQSLRVLQSLDSHRLEWQTSPFTHPCSPKNPLPENFSTNYPPLTHSLTRSLAHSVTLSPLLSPAPVHKASICLQPQHPWPFVPSAGASESTHGRPSLCARHA